MKVAIYPNFGSIYVPPFIKSQLSNKSWVQDRVEIADIIEKLPPTCDEITPEIYLAYEHSDKGQDYLKDKKNPNCIFVKNFEEKYGQTYQITVETVQPRRLWKIDEYDGAEGIVYFKKPQIEDKKLMYATW